MNKLILTGNLVKDPILKCSPQDEQVVEFRLATDEFTERGKHREVHNCKAYGDDARIIAKHGKKGRLMSIEGRSRTERYGKEGDPRYFHYCRVESYQFLRAAALEDDDAEVDTKADKSREYLKEEREFDEIIRQLSSVPDREISSRTSGNRAKMLREIGPLTKNGDVRHSTVFHHQDSSVQIEVWFYSNDTRVAIFSKNRVTLEWCLLAPSVSIDQICHRHHFTEKPAALAS